MTSTHTIGATRDVVELDLDAAASITGGTLIRVEKVIGWIIKNWKDIEEGYQSVCPNY